MEINPRFLPPVGRSRYFSGMSHEAVSTLGTVILARLKDMDRTQGWLAERVGVSDAAVSKWIRTGKISRAHLLAVSQALGVTMAQLMGEPGVGTLSLWSFLAEHLEEADREELAEYIALKARRISAKEVGPGYRVLYGSIRDTARAALNLETAEDAKKD